MKPNECPYLLSLIMPALFLGGTAWANTEVDDAIFDTSSYPGTTCQATPTGLSYDGTATICYAETAEPGPWIGDSPVTSTSDVDLYEFVIEAGSVSAAHPAIVICEVTRDFVAGIPGTDPGALDPYVILWDENGTLPGLMGQDDYASEGGCTAQDSYMVCGITTAGTYYLGVSSLVGDGSQAPGYDPNDCGSQGVNYTYGGYDITITLIPPSAVGGPHEDDNCILDAMVLGPINLDQDYDGVVGDGKYGGSSGDYDLYEFIVAENCSLITATVKTDSIGSDLQAVVNIYDGSCAILQQALHFDPHQAIDGEQPCDGDTVCQWIVANSGTYYMDVHGNGTGSQFEDCGPATGAYAGGGAGSVGNYRLRVHVDGPGNFPTPTDPVTEPNDWVGDAVATGLDQCGECYVLTGAFVGDGPCGCVSGNDTVGGDFDVYELYIPTGCELLVCLETVERGDSQLDALVTIWSSDGEGLLLMSMVDPICDGQCMWFCNPGDAVTTKYYLSVSGVDVPTNITTAPNPPACDNDFNKNGVTGVGYYDIYVSMEPYLQCQPAAWTDLCQEHECGYYPCRRVAYLLRAHDDSCSDDFDTELADDFTVPEGWTWLIEGIHAQFYASLLTGQKDCLVMANGSPPEPCPPPPPDMGLSSPEPSIDWDTFSTVPSEIRFRIYANSEAAGCLVQDIPDDSQILWEYTVTGYEACSLVYDRGWINLFADPAKRYAICPDRSPPGYGFLELAAGKYWLSIVCRHSARDIGGRAYGWVTSNRPGSPCFHMANGSDAQWKLNAGWGPGPPDLPCGADWNRVLRYFQYEEFADCDYDLAWKLSGLESEPTCCTTCMGDMKPACDGFVNVTDFTVFALAYPSTSADPNYDICADVAPAGGDGFVNITDFTAWAVNYPGPCP